MNAADLYPEILRPYDPRVTPLPPPTQGVCDGPVYTICINEFWWSHVSGVIARLLYRDAWDGTDDEIDAAINSISKILNVGRPTMGCGCGDSGLPSRINSDGVYQVSHDGGVTWVDAPQLDPRNNMLLYPPLGGADGDDKQCQSATNVRHWMQDHADHIIADLHTGDSIGVAIAAIFALLVVFVETITLGAATPLLIGLAAAILGVGTGALDAALTSTVYATFQCIVYCHIRPDASFTDADMVAIKTDINAQIGGIAQTFLLKTIDFLGKTGLANMARTPSGETADCSTCHCDDTWCYDGDFTLRSYSELFSSFQPTSNPGVYNTSWTLGVGWQTANGDPNYSYIQFPLASVSGLTVVCFTSTGSDAVDMSKRVTEHEDGVGGIGSLGCAGTGDFAGYNWIGYGKRSRGIITNFHMEGTGTIPAIFGEASNC